MLALRPLGGVNLTAMSAPDTFKLVELPVSRARHNICALPGRQKWFMSVNSSSVVSESRLSMPTRSYSPTVLIASGSYLSLSLRLYKSQSARSFRYPPYANGVA